MPPSRHHVVSTGFAVEGVNVTALLQTGSQGGVRPSAQKTTPGRRSGVANPSACNKNGTYDFQVLKDGKKFSFLPEFVVARVRVRVRVGVSLCL